MTITPVAAVAIGVALLAVGALVIEMLARVVRLLKHTPDSLRVGRFFMHFILADFRRGVDFATRRHSVLY